MLYKTLFYCLLVMCSALATHAHAQSDWKAIEKVATYSISGQSGGELYRSIGQNGPKIGNDIRTIAHTNYTLTWSRRYKTDDGNCTLVSAKPKLTITYTLPKPSQKLAPETAKEWNIFLSGIEKHEHIHGDYIKEMVQKIEASTVGMSVANDPKCSEFKIELNKKLSELFQEQRQRGRDFDRADMAQGGNIHQLILALVNSQ